MALCALLVGCATPTPLRGTLTGSTYTSPSGSFSCNIPLPRASLDRAKISDLQESDGEMLSVYVQYSWRYRLDHARVGGNELTTVDQSLPLTDQLRVLNTSLLEVTASENRLRTEQILLEDLHLEQRRGLFSLFFLREPNAGEELRGLLLVHQGSHFTIFHYTHPALTAEYRGIGGTAAGTVAKVRTRLLQFVTGCEFKAIGGQSSAVGLQIESPTWGGAPPNKPMKRTIDPRVD